MRDEKGVGRSYVLTVKNEEGVFAGFPSSHLEDKRFFFFLKGRIREGVNFNGQKCLNLYS